MLDNAATVATEIKGKLGRIEAANSSRNDQRKRDLIDVALTKSKIIVVKAKYETKLEDQNLPRMVKKLEFGNIAGKSFRHSLSPGTMQKMKALYRNESEKFIAIANSTMNSVIQEVSRVAKNPTYGKGFRKVVNKFKKLAASFNGLDKSITHDSTAQKFIREVKKQRVRKISKVAEYNVHLLGKRMERIKFYETIFSKETTKSLHKSLTPLKKPIAKLLRVVAKNQEWYTFLKQKYASFPYPTIQPKKSNKKGKKVDQRRVHRATLFNAVVKAYNTSQLARYGRIAANGMTKQQTKEVEYLVMEKDNEISYDCKSVPDTLIIKGNNISMDDANFEFCKMNNTFILAMDTVTVTKKRLDFNSNIFIHAVRVVGPEDSSSTIHTGHTYYDYKKDPAPGGHIVVVAGSLTGNLVFSSKGGSKTLRKGIPECEANYGAPPGAVIVIQLFTNKTVGIKQIVARKFPFPTSADSSVKHILVKKLALSLQNFANPCPIANLAQYTCTQVCNVFLIFTQQKQHL